MSSCTCCPLSVTTTIELLKGMISYAVLVVTFPLDTMALIPIINGAGGIITDYQGNDATIGDSVIAATPNIHKEVVSILNN